MASIVFIAGMERFNAHVWDDVAQSLDASGVGVAIQRFHDGHIDAQDPALVAAIAGADVLFVTLINTRQQADWIAAQLDRAPVATVFAFESMPEVMRLTRVGEYRVTGEKGGVPKPMRAVLNMITRGRDEDTLYAYTKLTKLTAKLLPLMPAKLKDFRTWLSVNIYWNQPDAANLTQMIRLILRDCCGQTLDVAPARLIPMMGCFHPDAEQLFDGPDSYLRWYRKRRPTKRGELARPLVAVLAFRKHIVQRQRYLTELVRALEAAGLDVLPVMVSGIEAHVAVREWLAKQPIDLLMSTMGFPLVGGPAGSTSPGKYHQTASDLLAALDVPYMIVQPLQMQDEASWHASGVAPMQAVIMYDLPEMDGSIAPVALGAIRGQEIVAAPDRLARAARQAAGWARLRRTANAEKRLGLIVYNFPPGLGKVATAALLDVPASLHALLLRLRADGYDVQNIPATPQALAEQLAALDTAASAATTLPLSEYRALIPAAHADRIEQFWGAAPGTIAPAGRDAMRLDTLTFGKVVVGVQPSMGVPGDPMRLLFAPEFTPHHQYAAFYRWLTHVWRADALVHVGMHGTAEWMPGLQLGLTETCWPDLLLGALPNLYLYPLNNPAEAAIARRRGYATIVSHLVPPYARAGSYKQLAVLRAQLEGPDHERPALPDLPRRDAETEGDYRRRAVAYLNTIEQRLILDGLHTFGTAPSPERAATLIEAALEIPRADQPGLSALLATHGVAAEDLVAARTEFVRTAVLQVASHPSLSFVLPPDIVTAPAFAPLVTTGRAILAGLLAAGGELDALLHALGGGYVRPAHGADPVRGGAGALPSGRNIHGIDPWRLPSETALVRGAQMAEQLIARHRAAHGGAHPHTVALTLWALDTVKSEGESIAVALALVGARPERDGQGKIWRYSLVPLEDLGRPRIDLLLDISAIFRDTFQMSLDLLDDLFRRAAEADEPPTSNPIRANALEQQRRGATWDEATARIFTQAPGYYGTGVDERIEEGQWDEAGDLSDTYLHRNSHTYGGGRGGVAAPAALRALLGSVDHIFQPIDSVEYGLTDMQHYYGHAGAIQLAAKQQTGVAPQLSFGESYTGTVTVSGADEILRLEARSKLLNPRWYEPLLAHGHAGAAEISSRFTYLVGWSATTGMVDGWVYDGMAATFVLDEAVRSRLEAANPHAARNAVARLLEANGRNLWQTDDATIERLQTIYANLEDRLELV